MVAIIEESSPVDMWGWTAAACMSERERAYYVFENNMFTSGKYRFFRAYSFAADKDFNFSNVTDLNKLTCADNGIVEVGRFFIKEKSIPYADFPHIYMF